MDPGTCGFLFCPHTNPWQDRRIAFFSPLFKPHTDGQLSCDHRRLLSYIRMVTVALRVLSLGHTELSCKRVLLRLETPSTSLLPTWPISRLWESQTTSVTARWEGRTSTPQRPRPPSLGTDYSLPPPLSPPLKGSGTGRQNQDGCQVWSIYHLQVAMATLGNEVQ